MPSPARGRCGTLPCRFANTVSSANISRRACKTLSQHRRTSDSPMPEEPPTKFPGRLPSGEYAIVSRPKICDYLLSPTHPIGRFKAAFFSTLGYTIDNWERLQQDLLELARSGEAFAGQESRYGQKYEVRGTLVGPSGRQADLVTVWIVMSDAPYPQLVTAYPGE
jgi:hypothetical protein